MADAFWTIEGLRAVTGGTITARRAAANDTHGVSIDTRTLKPGQVFAAMVGSRTDGHDHVGQAAERGASIALVERDAVDAPANLGMVRVESVADALVAMARAWRRQLVGTRVIVVTGSNGKTTTTRLIDAVLGQAMRGTCSIKSFNNRLGVPITVLNARRGDAYLICEIGMNAPGEIAELTGIVDPDIGVITSVGRAHLEGVGSIEGVAREKASLLTSMRDGTVRIAPAPCAVLDPFVDALAGLVRVGTSDADVTVEIVDAAATGVRFAISGIAEPLHVPLLGEHNGNNAAMAAVVGRRCGLDDEAIRAGLEAVENEPMRLQAESVAGVLLLNDAYNANPESMRAGLRVLADVAGGRRRVAVLGTMHELGAESDELHRDIGAFAREHRLADVVIAVEGSASQIAAGFGEGASVVSDSTDDAMATIAGMIQPNDAVLLKGSRRVGLERIAQHLRAGAPA